MRHLSLVGIIANPDSGRDIRRVASHALVVGNQEKANIVARVLLALAAVGVERIAIMPDHFGIGLRALRELANDPTVQAATSLIDMELEGNQRDSAAATRWLVEQGAGCIVVLGGDGTCRVVAKAAAATPILPISTGTNNVVPAFVEATIAGLAAGYVALHSGQDPAATCYRHKVLTVYVNGREADQALVDVALVAARFTGARAVWQPGLVRQVFVSRAQPTSIGMSAIIGVIRPVGLHDPWGATATIGTGSNRVLVPIAPGSLLPVAVDDVQVMNPGERHPVLAGATAALALDGERELIVGGDDQASVALSLEGPWLVDVERTLGLAVAEGLFRRLGAAIAGRPSLQTLPR